MVSAALAPAGVRTPAQYLATSTTGALWKPGTTVATRVGQAAVAAARDGWRTEQFRDLPVAVEKRLVGAAQGHVARGQKAPELVVQAAGLLGRVSATYDYAVWTATGDDPLDRDLLNATFASFDLLVQGKAEQVVLDAVSAAGERGSSVEWEYKRFVRELNGRMPGSFHDDPAVLPG